MPIAELVKPDLNVKQMTLEIPRAPEPDFPFGITMPPQIREKMLKDIDFLKSRPATSMYNARRLDYQRAIGYFFPGIDFYENKRTWEDFTEKINQQKATALAFKEFYAVTGMLTNIKLINPHQLQDSVLITKAELDELYDLFEEFRKKPVNQEKNQSWILAGYVDFIILQYPKVLEMDPKSIWEEVDGDKIARQTINRTASELEPIGNISPLIDLKILSPSLFKKLNILNNEEFARKMREKLRRTIEIPSMGYLRVGENESELPVIYYYMQILSADDVRITDDGLELIWNNKNKNKVLETPIPEERSF